jgi:hypothetical protein
LAVLDPLADQYARFWERRELYSGRKYTAVSRIEGQGRMSG